MALDVVCGGERFSATGESADLGTGNSSSSTSSKLVSDPVEKRVDRVRWLLLVLFFREGYLRLRERSIEAR